MVDTRVPARERDLADSTARVIRRGAGVELLKTGRHLVKLRESECEQRLAVDVGPAWGEVLESKPALRWTPSSTVSTHGAQGPAVLDGPIDVPERRLRLYHGATWYGRQVFSMGRDLLPDTFRHQVGQRTLSQRALVTSSPRMGRLKSSVEPRRTVRESGTFYHLDTEFPGHFGHVTTEVLSRWWGWERAREVDPLVRPLVSTYRRGGVIPSFQRQMFRALDVPLDHALVTWPGRAVELEHLVAATPDFENPHYAAPELREVWDRLLRGIPDPGGPRPERVFVSRRPGGARHCEETPEVEAWFAARGFEVVYPEEVAYEQQVHMFAAARVVAGFAGSGLLNIIFAPGARVVVISGTSYAARNEQLVGAVNENEVHYFWGRSIVPPDASAVRTLKAPFSFSIEQHAAELTSLL